MNLNFEWSLICNFTEYHLSLLNRAHMGSSWTFSPRNRFLWLPAKLWPGLLLPFRPRRTPHNQLCCYRRAPCHRQTRSAQRPSPITHVKLQAYSASWWYRCVGFFFFILFSSPAGKRMDDMCKKQQKKISRQSESVCLTLIMSMCLLDVWLAELSCVVLSCVVLC